MNRMKYLRINNNYVDQSEIKISKKKLITSHLGTCSAILFSLNNINFMAHIDAVYNKKEQLIKIIRNNFNIKELKKIDIYIVVGEWCNKNCISINIIKNSLHELELSYKILNNIKWKNTISIDNNNINII
jgi:hypothetical protein